LSPSTGSTLEQLEASAAVSRGRRQNHPLGLADHRRLWRPPTGAELLAMLDVSPTHDLRELAHVWLAWPPDPTPPAAGLPAQRVAPPAADAGGEMLDHSADSGAAAAPDCIGRGLGG
jgi:hypothetical protein